MSDLISRQAAIDSIMEEPSEARYPVFYAEKIRQLQSAQQWIPVTERLPNKYIGEWMCCDKYGNIFMLRYENTTPNGDCVFCYTDDDGYYVSVHDIVAWMPLPMPYSATQTEKSS